MFFILQITEKFSIPDRVCKAVILGTTPTPAAPRGPGRSPGSSFRLDLGILRRDIPGRPTTGRRVWRAVHACGRSDHMGKAGGAALVPCAGVRLASTALPTRPARRPHPRQLPPTTLQLGALPATPRSPAPLTHAVRRTRGEGASPVAAVGGALRLPGPRPPARLCTRASLGLQDMTTNCSSTAPRRTSPAPGRTDGQASRRDLPRNKHSTARSGRVCFSSRVGFKLFP